MRRLAVIALFLTAARLSGAPCTPSPTRLCLNGGRFGVEVAWKDFQGTTGAGQAISLTGDTGYFWFFSSNNVELVVKVLDGRALNSNFWVFYGALSNVEYTMTVTDSASGAVKTYANPAGRFASAGDTAAFPTAPSRTLGRRDRNSNTGGGPDTEKAIAELSASSQLALRESLLDANRHPAGTSAEAVTCTGTATSLCLNGGRFRVQVAWTDFAGKTGAGTAVGLTADTGYFWFFSSNNVELAVKVLDARALNGRFWVFYGALSNVEYTMTVTDTLTGVVRTYSNPSGQFASTGDTDGFSTGFSVAANLDATRAVTTVVPATGGTATATAADGTTFTLTVPAGALLSDEEITLTPVVSIDRLPVSGGLTAGVQIAPEGLLLFTPATLVIASPSPVPAAEEVTFAWRGAGDEFFLFPPDPAAASSVSLSILHLSSYGVGRGTAADESALRARVPGNPQDALDQNLQEPAAAQRLALRGGASLTGKTAASERAPNAKTPAQELATRQLSDAINDLTRTLPTRCSDDWPTWVSQLANVQQRVFQLTGPDPTLSSATISLYSTVFKLLLSCYDSAYATCRSNSDPAQGQEMLRIYGFLANRIGLTGIDKTKIQKCLTFELTFNSFILENQFQNGAGATWAFRHQVKSVVPGIPAYIPTFPDPGTQIAELSYPLADFTGQGGDSKCTLRTNGTPSVFTVLKLTLDVNVYFEKESSANTLRVSYDPGHPDYTFVLSCEQSPEISITQPRWRQIYEAHHAQELDPTHTFFEAHGWTEPGGGDPYAFVGYEPQSAAGQETTAIKLKHTPQ